jgi:hypothetical protein
VRNVQTSIASSGHNQRYLKMIEAQAPARQPTKGALVTEKPLDWHKILALVDKQEQQCPPPNVTELSDAEVIRKHVQRSLSK